MNSVTASRRARRLLPAAIVTASLIFSCLVTAQAPLAVDGAYFLADATGERPLLVEVLLYPDDTGEGAGESASLRLLEAPPRAGQPEGLAYAGTGSVTERKEASLRIVTDRAQVQLPLLWAGSLDPLGTGSLTLEGSPAVTLQGIGTFLVGKLELADATFALQRQEPFLYAEPWSSVQPTSFPLDASMREGLEQRLALSEAVHGIFTESYTSRIEALDHDLLSVFTLFDTFTGGAHPNTYRSTTTLLHGQDGWAQVENPCDAAAHLGWACSPQVVRERVIRQLEAAEAAWVVQGEVGEATDWLLDLFVLTPGGIRFIFDPYAVGPYVQGAFEVLIPYGELD